VGGN
jgi:hypothetical protein